MTASLALCCAKRAVRRCSVWVAGHIRPAILAPQCIIKCSHARMIIKKGYCTQYSICRRNEVGKAFWRALYILNCLVKAPSVLHEYLDPVLSTVISTSLQYGLFMCSVMNSLFVSGLPLSVLSDYIKTPASAGFAVFKSSLTRRLCQILLL